MLFRLVCLLTVVRYSSRRDPAIRSGTNGSASIFVEELALKGGIPLLDFAMNT